MIRPSGRDVKLFNDELFVQLRQKAGVADNFCNEGWDLEKLEHGGGKGGCLMAFLGSDFIVKEMSYGDHLALLAVSKGYVEHVRYGDTLLAAIYLHFEDLSTGRKFYVMRNVLGSGPFLAMYDLKGCNDDKTIELFGKKIEAARMLISNAGRICGYPYAGADSMCAYSAGKWAASRADLVVTEKQRKNVLHMIQRDTDWLKSMHLMDYSLIVGVKTGPANFASVKGDPSGFGCKSFARKCSDGSEIAVCVGIIDFLQLWTLKKMCARVIKCLECNKATIPPAAYAARFCDHFENRFVAAKVVTSPIKSSMVDMMQNGAHCQFVEAALDAHEQEDSKLVQVASTVSESDIAQSADNTGKGVADQAHQPVATLLECTSEVPHPTVFGAQCQPS